MSKYVKWKGIFPAVTTKFKEDGSLDTEEMERCYKLQIDAGIDGIVVCGSLGEASTLDPSEKLEILKAAQGVAGDRPVLLTICDGSTRNAQTMAEKGAEMGASGLMVLPGLPYKSDRRETIAHLKAVAHAGGLPVMIYNNPVSYGTDVRPVGAAVRRVLPGAVGVVDRRDGNAFLCSAIGVGDAVTSGRGDDTGHRAAGVSGVILIDGGQTHVTGVIQHRRVVWAGHVDHHAGD